MFSFLFVRGLMGPQDSTLQTKKKGGAWHICGYEGFLWTSFSHWASHLPSGQKPKEIKPEHSWARLKQQPRAIRAAPETPAVCLVSQQLCQIYQKSPRAVSLPVSEVSLLLSQSSKSLKTSKPRGCWQPRQSGGAAADSLALCLHRFFFVQGGCVYVSSVCLGMSTCVCI